MTPEQKKRRGIAIAKAKAEQKQNNEFQGGRPPFGFVLEGGVLRLDVMEQYALGVIKFYAGCADRPGYGTIATELKRDFGVEVNRATVKRYLEKFKKALKGGV